MALSPWEFTVHEGPDKEAGRWSGRSAKMPTMTAMTRACALSATAMAATVVLAGPAATRVSGGARASAWMGAQAGPQALLPGTLRAGSPLVAASRGMRQEIGDAAPWYEDEGDDSNNGRG